MRRVLFIVLAACGPAVGGPEDAGDTFLAFPTDFKGYTHWESHTLSSAPAQGEVHASGERTMYLSRRPPSGASEFPVGTIIVKALPGVGRVFARVKRGGGYNPDQMTKDGLVVGSLNWEWFELQHTSAEEVTLVWRGVGPPNGEGYGGDPNGCNSCHAAAKANDYVSAEDLRLTSF